MLFSHNFVFLNHNADKISASTHLNDGRNYALLSFQSTLVSWPNTCIYLEAVAPMFWVQVNLY